MARSRMTSIRRLFVVFGLSHDPGRSLAGIFFAVVVVKSGSQLLYGISNIRQPGHETCPTKRTNTGCRTPRDGLVNSEGSICHALAFT
jgi:hypothetical protein